MTPKKMFINICLALIVFSLFVLFFLKPKYGVQFEVLDTKSDKYVPTTTVLPTSTPSVSHTTTPDVSPAVTP